MDALMFESEPYVKIQVADGSHQLQSSFKKRTNAKFGVDRSKAKELKVKTPAVKDAALQQVQSHPFALQHWLDQPYEDGPLLLIKDPVANQICNGPERRDLPWNFLEGRSTNEERPNGSAVDEFVRGIGSWADEGEVPPFERSGKQGKWFAREPDAPWGGNPCKSCLISRKREWRGTLQIRPNTKARGKRRLLKKRQPKIPEWTTIPNQA